MEAVGEAAREEARAAGHDPYEVGSGEAEALQEVELGLKELEVGSGDGRLAMEDLGDVGIIAAVDPEEVGRVSGSGELIKGSGVGSEGADEV